MGSGRKLRRTHALRPVVRTHPKPEPLRFASVLRVARLDLEAQSARHVRRLESARELRGRSILTTRLTAASLTTEWRTPRGHDLPCGRRGWPLRLHARR